MIRTLCDRGIGRLSGEHHDIHGDFIVGRSEYAVHLEEVLPSKEDDEELLRIVKEGDWIKGR